MDHLLGPDLPTALRHYSRAPICALHVVHSGSEMYWSREIFKDCSQPALLRGCQGNWTAPPPAEKRRMNLPLSWGTSDVATAELLALENTASAPGGTLLLGAMGRISGLVPSRFLTLLAHLVVVITLFWSRDSNIQACLPLTFTPEEYEKQDIQLVAALSVTLGLFAVELTGFFSGVSMFNSTQSLFSIGAHCSASVALSFFIFERWECTMYWYIFVFCSALPAVTEVVLFISVFGLKKKPF